METEIIDVSIKLIYEIIERYVFLRIENVWFSALCTDEPIVCFEEPGSIENHRGYVINMITGEVIGLKAYYEKKNIDVKKQPIFVFDKGPFNLEDVIFLNITFYIKDGHVVSFADETGMII